MYWIPDIGHIGYIKFLLQKHQRPSYPFRSWLWMFILKTDVNISIWKISEMRKMPKNPPEKLTLKFMICVSCQPCTIWQLSDVCWTWMCIETPITIPFAPTHFPTTDIVNTRIRLRYFIVSYYCFHFGFVILTFSMLVSFDLTFFLLAIRICFEFCSKINVENNSRQFNGSFAHKIVWFYWWCCDDVNWLNWFNKRPTNIHYDLEQIILCIQ